MVWIPEGTSKKDEAIILEMASEDEEMVSSVMKQENLDYWEAIEWCLERPLLNNPEEYIELLDIHRQEVQEQNKPISFTID